MGWNMLTNAGPGVTSPWVRIEPSHSLDLPLSFFFINGNGAPWSAGNVNVEILVNGLPGGGNTPYKPQTDTGTVQLLAAVPPPAGANILDVTSPVEWIRCRTDPGLVGTVSVNLAES